MNVALGQAVPPSTPHAISVSLPTWADNVGYEEGEKRVVEKMINGYPRFFIHLSIQKLSSICEHKFGVSDERCMLFPTERIANLCRDFIQSRSDANARLIHLFVCPESSTDGSCADLHIVLFPSYVAGVAKQFWQHTGLGISSRLAEHCLCLMESGNASISSKGPVSAASTTLKAPFKTLNRHYSSISKGSSCVPCSSPLSSAASPPTAAPSGEVADVNIDQYLEERYGRNLPPSYGASAKRALKRRIARVLIHDPHASIEGSPKIDDSSDIEAGQKDTAVGPSARGVKDVSEDDVYLYPTGMSAIWSAHNLIGSIRPSGKSVCFGFPYTDTLKILEKWGPGCHFLGHGLDSDLPSLEGILTSASRSDPSRPPILALFTEFPSNPLLRSANLPKLRELADEHDFLIVVDETLGNFMNVEVLPYADIVVSSLTKIFSGDANAMGGSLVLNPHSKHYSFLKSHLTAHYEDTYFDQDAIFLERNSRDFARRTKVIDRNTEAICDFLLSRSVAGGANDAQVVLEDVFYPKYKTTENYEACRVKNRDSDDGKKGAGFGGLFSVTFKHPNAAKAFFDHLDVLKGPSLGTNFSIACPYTVLAHYAELDWARQWGVDPDLVRVSIGMEPLEGNGGLFQVFQNALKAAEAAPSS